jgi:glyoxylase-like metal-dependent hydrolase (beta-lactamase superfamily II)
MMKGWGGAVLLAAGLGWAAAGQAQTGTIDRLHVLDCGELHLQDGGRVSPSAKGKPMDLLNSCYLIQSGQDYMLWETGAPDALVTKPAPTDTALVLTRSRTLESQLAALGVKPADLRYVAISHTHGDHAGNVDLFPTVTLLMQKAEYDAAFAEGRNPPFSRSQPVKQVEGDLDVFGNGAVTILATPGHTAGHQSLLVRLEKTGPVVLAGDAIQAREQWERYQAAPASYDERLTPGIKRIAELAAKNKAQVWFSHDSAQNKELRAGQPYE